VNGKHKPINGWTKAKMLERIQQYVPNTSQGCRVAGSCKYQHPEDESSRCAVGAMLDGKALKLANVLEGTVYSVVQTLPSLEELLPLPVWAMRSLQVAHDSAIDRTRGTARQACIDWINENVEDDQ
jgi:hypothetical protein